MLIPFSRRIWATSAQSLSRIERWLRDPAQIDGKSEEMSEADVSRALAAVALFAFSPLAKANSVCQLRKAACCSLNTALLWHRIARLRCPSKCVRSRIFKQFVAVLVGNLVYFFVLMPHLPPLGQHVPYRLDVGLLVDLWVCLVFYGAVEFIDRKLRRNHTATESRKS